MSKYFKVVTNIDACVWTKKTARVGRGLTERSSIGSSLVRALDYVDVF